MIHAETNQPVYHESSLHRFVPLTKGDRGCVLKCMAAWMDEQSAKRREKEIGMRQ
jgi:hypothetical protein